MNQETQSVRLNPQQAANQISELLSAVYNNRQDPGLRSLRVLLEARLRQKQNKLLSCDPSELGRLQGACTEIQSLLDMMAQAPLNLN